VASALLHRQKAKYYPPRELSYVIITIPAEIDFAPEGAKRELAEVLSTQPIQ
jgi:hypothetical protein